MSKTIKEGRKRGEPGSEKEDGRIQGKPSKRNSALVKCQAGQWVWFAKKNYTFFCLSVFSLNSFTLNLVLVLDKCL